MTQRARIQHLPTGEWRLDTDETVYCITSINAHCTRKLEVLHDAHKPVYLTLEPITEYVSDEYRTRIHPSIADWDDERDVYCLVSEVPIADDGITSAEIEAKSDAEYVQQLILDAFLGLANDGIFEIHIEEK